MLLTFSFGNYEYSEQWSEKNGINASKQYVAYAAQAWPEFVSPLQYTFMNEQLFLKLWAAVTCDELLL